MRCHCERSPVLHGVQGEVKVDMTRIFGLAMIVYCKGIQLS